MTIRADKYGNNRFVADSMDFVHHLVGGGLTESGEQWSDEDSTVAADEDKEVFKSTLDKGFIGDLFELVFGLTLAIKAGSATADVKYKWQARNKDGAWVDLHDYMTIADVGTSYEGNERTMPGYRTPEDHVPNLNTYPIDVRLIIQSNETTPGVATAKVKNSSYVEVKLK